MDLGGENVGGLGYPLSQQLLAAGEEVLDVPPKLAARVRLVRRTARLGPAMIVHSLTNALAILFVLA
jgi:hypothetical protein